jgi:hypothetical protein
VTTTAGKHAPIDEPLARTANALHANTAHSKRSTPYASHANCDTRQIYVKRFQIRHAFNTPSEHAKYGAHQTRHALKTSRVGYVSFKRITRKRCRCMARSRSGSDAASWWKRPRSTQAAAAISLWWRALLARVVSAWFSASAVPISVPTLCWLR